MVNDEVAVVEYDVRVEVRVDVIMVVDVVINWINEA